MKFSHPFAPPHGVLVDIYSAMTEEERLKAYRQTSVEMVGNFAHADVEKVHCQQVKVWALLEAAGFGGDTEPEPEPPKAV